MGKSSRKCSLWPNPTSNSPTSFHKFSGNNFSSWFLVSSGVLYSVYIVWEFENEIKSKNEKKDKIHINIRVNFIAICSHSTRTVSHPLWLRPAQSVADSMNVHVDLNDERNRRRKKKSNEYRKAIQSVNSLTPMPVVSSHASFMMMWPNLKCKYREKRMTWWWHQAAQCDQSAIKSLSSVVLTHLWP